MVVVLPPFTGMMMMIVPRRGRHRRHSRVTAGTAKLSPASLFVMMTTTLLLLLGGVIDLAEAVLPTGELRLADGVTAYAAPAWFGLQLPEETEAKFLPLRVPKGAADGCDDVTVDDPPANGGGFVLLVERGNCFFDVKALAAQVAGAEGLVVMNSIEGIYQVCSLCVYIYMLGLMLLSCCAPVLCIKELECCWYCCVCATHAIFCK